MKPKKFSDREAVKSAVTPRCIRGLGAAVFCVIAFQSTAFGRLTSTIDIPSARTLGNGIIELGGGSGIYKLDNTDTYSNDEKAWANFGVAGRLEGGITLHTSTRASANIKLLLIDGGNLPSLAVGVKNITGKKRETFTTGAPGDEAISNSVYGVISQTFHIGKSLLTLSAGKGNRTFVDETGDFEGLRGAFAGIKLNAGGICAAVEEDGRDVNCSLSYNFPTGISIGADARNLKENLAPKMFGIFFNFSNTLIEKRIAALEAKIETLTSGITIPAKDTVPPGREKKQPGQNKKISAKNFKKAMAFYNNKKYEKSIPLFENSLRLSPGNKETEKYLKTAKIKTYFMKGHKLFSEKKYAQSIKFFEKVIRLSPGHSASEGYINRARYLQIKQ